MDEAAMLKAAAHPVRVKILADLSRGDRGAATLRELAGDDPLSLRAHLAALRRAGLINRRTSGDGGPTYGLSDVGRALAEIIAQLVEAGLLPG